MSIEPNSIITYEKETQIENSYEDLFLCDDESDNESVSSDKKCENLEISVINNEHKDKRQIYNDFEKMRIFNDEKFQKFLDYSSKVTQRVLHLTEKENETFINYSERDESFDEKQNEIELNKCLFNSQLCKNRVVTGFDLCSQYNELLLTTYYLSENMSNDSDGLCLVWNLKYSDQTPEFKFTNRSPVMTGCFSKFNPNLIIGGTYCGQIVIWDNRLRRSTPIMSSTVSPQGHTHPVYCVEVNGSENVHNLISISNDGKMCYWDLNVLTKPIDSFELVHESISSPLLMKLSKPVLASSMSFPFDDCNDFIIGCENGNLFSVEKNSAHIQQIFEGHEEYVTSVECNPSLENSHIFLTSSLDWTIKLWNSKETEPLCTFNDNRDSIYDLKWSPNRPTVFASVDGMGYIDVWDLNQDFHRPSASVKVDESIALNKIIWTKSGKQVVAGDSIGRVWVYNIEESFADNSMKLNDTIHEMKSNESE
jgi:dynein intermediate chain